MKFMTLRKKRLPMNLQIFAGSGEGGDGGQDDNAGDEGDSDVDDEGNDNGGNSDDTDEKKYSQKDMDDAVKKRLAREKRKWQREQQKKSSKDDNSGSELSDDGGDAENQKDSELEKERRRNERLTIRLACYDAGVPKDYVKDVTALAKAYMEEDDELDFEDAIEKVLKKYPAFKGQSNGSEKGAWGQRQKGKGSGKEKSLEDEITEALYGN